MCRTVLSNTMAAGMTFLSDLGEIRQLQDAEHK